MPADAFDQTALAALAQIGQTNRACSDGGPFHANLWDTIPKGPSFGDFPPTTNYLLHPAGRIAMRMRRLMTASFGQAFNRRERMTFIIAVQGEEEGATSHGDLGNDG